MLHRIALTAAFAALSMPAEAQVPRVVASCGSSSIPVGPGGYQTVDTSGNLCTTGGSGGASSTGSVTPGGTPGTQAQAVQGIPNGVPQNVIAQDAVVPTGYPATITATGPLPGFRTTGANSVMFAATGTVNATVQFSLDSTNGTDGTWNTYAAGQYPKDSAYFYTGDVSSFNGNVTENVINFPANGTVWLRANVSSFSAGATIGAWLRSQPYVQRNVGQRALAAGANVIGGIQSASTFSEAFRTALAANATQTGATRDLGATVERYARFGASVVTDQSGSLQIQTSTDGTNWITVATQAVAANTPVDVSMPIRARYHRAVFTNGGTATSANGFSLLTSFTAG